MKYLVENSKKDILRLLKRSVTEFNIVRYFFGDKNNSFYGLFFLNRFRLYKTIQKNKFTQILLGKVNEKNDKSIIKIRFSPTIYIKVFSFLVLFTVIIFLVSVINTVISGNFKIVQIITIISLLTIVSLIFFIQKYILGKKNKMYLLEEFEEILSKNNIGFKRSIILSIDRKKNSSINKDDMFV